MKTYKVSFTATVNGFFTNTEYKGVEYVEGKSEKEVYERRSEYARVLSFMKGFPIMITNVEEVK